MRLLHDVHLLSSIPPVIVPNDVAIRSPSWLYFVIAMLLVLSIYK